MSCIAEENYLYIDLDGMKNAKSKLNRSIEEAKEQRDNITRAIESLQVPDGVLRRYGDELISVKNTISKGIDELIRIIAHIDYVVRRFEEVDDEFARRFSQGGYEIQEKSVLPRQSALFEGCNQYGPFMLNNNFLYDSQRMLDYLNGEPLDKTWMLIASSRGWGPITYEEFCRRMAVQQGVGYSALLEKWGARGSYSDIQGTADSGKDVNIKKDVISAATSLDSLMGYGVAALKKGGELYADNVIYNQAIPNSSSKVEMYRNMFNVVDEVDNFKNATNLAKGGIKSVGTKIGIAGAFIGGGIQIASDINNNNYSITQKKTAVAIDVGSTALSVFAVVGCALIPGVGWGIAAGFAAGFVINVVSDYAKDWLVE